MVCIVVFVQPPVMQLGLEKTVKFVWQGIGMFSDTLYIIAINIILITNICIYFF